MQILSNTYVNDNTAVTNNKLRPLLNKFNKNFAKICNISNRVSIDESMILFKGRSSIKQYNPMKPIKRDYKLRSMGDMDSYLFQLDVYQGKDKALPIDSYREKHFGLGKKVVYRMTKPFHGKNHKVYCDNYFSSVSPAKYLLSKKVHMRDIIKSN